MSDPFDAAPSDRMFDSADYELCWPRELFIRELTALRAIGRADERMPKVERLFEEVFLGDTPRQDLKGFDTRLGIPTTVAVPRDYVDELLAHAPQLREHRAPRPYWSARLSIATGCASTRSNRQLRADFARLITMLRGDGYFERALPTVCVDDRDSVPVEPNDVLTEHLGVPNLWPLEPDEWDDDTFYDLIEVFHDLAARPRTRLYHSFNDCGWHYGDFATDIGRALYRWRINDILDSGGVELRLANAGEDVGRLVRVVDDARTDLLERVMATPDSTVAARVEHAIALFRGRDATAHGKRSAAITLSGILEERRTLIRTEIGRKDDGALFSIANEFAIRHQRRDQQGDYDPAFLDWIVWWYLATIELTDRLLARQGAQHAPRPP